jgi:hypothetical protein
VTAITEQAISRAKLYARPSLMVIGCHAAISAKAHFRDRDHIMAEPDPRMFAAQALIPSAANWKSSCGHSARRVTDG